MGPVYMVAAGLPAYRPDHCAALACLALDMQAELKDFVDGRGRPLQVRLFFFAARMEFWGCTPVLTSS